MYVTYMEVNATYSLYVSQEIQCVQMCAVQTYYYQIIFMEYIGLQKYIKEREHVYSDMFAGCAEIHVRHANFNVSKVAESLRKRGTAARFMFSVWCLWSLALTLHHYICCGHGKSAVLE